MSITHRQRHRQRHDHCHHLVTTVIISIRTVLHPGVLSSFCVPGWNSAVLHKYTEGFQGAQCYAHIDTHRMHMYTGHGRTHTNPGNTPQKLCAEVMSLASPTCNNNANKSHTGTPTMTSMMSGKCSTLLTRLGGINSNGLAVVKLPRPYQHAQLPHHQPAMDSVLVVVVFVATSNSKNNSSYRYSWCPNGIAAKPPGPNTTMTTMANNCKL